MASIFGYVTITPPDKIRKSDLKNSSPSRGSKVVFNTTFKLKNLYCGFRFANNPKSQPIFLNRTSGSPPFSKQVFALDGYVHPTKKTNHSFNSTTSSAIKAITSQVFAQSSNDFTRHLEGAFALAAIDGQNFRLTLIKDGFGIKPLYYYSDDSCFVFSSQLSTLTRFIKSRQKITVASDSIEKYFIFGTIPGENSIYRQIRQLKQSSILCFDLKNWKFLPSKDHWQLHKTTLRKFSSTTVILKNIDKLLQEAVDKRLRPGQIGVTLSGGLDSSLIAYYLSRSTYQSKKINAYTIEYAGFSGSQDPLYSNIVANRLGLRHSNLIITDQDVLLHFREIMLRYDQPYFSVGAIPYFFLTKKASQEVDLLYMTTAGELMSMGFDRPTIKALDRFTRLSKLINPENSSLPINFFSQPLIENILFAHLFSASELRNLLNNPSFSKKTHLKEIAQIFIELTQKDWINKGQYLDYKFLNPHIFLPEGERQSAINQVETTWPYLDKTLMEFTFSVSGNWKTHHDINRYLQKQLVAKHLGDDIANRRPNRLIDNPLDHWIRGVLEDEFRRVLLRPNPFINLRFVRQLLENHLQQKSNNGFKLLCIYQFNLFTTNHHHAST